MRFLIEIQSEILDHYQGRLTDQLRTYEATISTMARTLHGITREEQARVEGVGGLDHLCRIYGSASHVILPLIISIVFYDYRVSAILTLVDH